MHVDLVRIKTSDDLVLHGAFLAPQGERPPAGVDAVLISPGTGGTFSSSPMADLAHLLAERGYPVLSLSTRGHGTVWRDGTLGRYFGSAFETISECPLDFTASIDWLGSRGYRRVANIGHSLGGTKVLYYAAHEPSAGLAATVSLDGPRWSGELFSQSTEKATYFRHCDNAAILVSEGRGDQLMEMTFPIGPTFVTAAGYLDKYGFEHYNVATWGDRITTPVLRVDAMATTGIVRALMVDVGNDIQRLAPNPHHKIIEMPTDHGFTGHLSPLADSIVGWFGTLPAA